MSGPKKEPSHIQLLKGNPSKRPVNENEPVPSAEEPVAPTFVNERIEEIFDTIVERIEEMGYCSASHTEMLTLLAVQLWRVEELAQIVMEEGETVTEMNSKGSLVRKRLPEAVALTEAVRSTQSLLAEFGLSPSSMTKVSLPKGKKEENPFKGLMGS